MTQNKSFFYIFIVFSFLLVNFQNCLPNTFKVSETLTEGVHQLSSVECDNTHSVSNNEINLDKLCKNGNASNLVSSNIGWTWVCINSNNISINCSAKKSNSDTTIQTGQCNSTLANPASTKPVTSLCHSGLATTVIETSTAYQWQCMGINSNINDTCLIQKKISIAGTCGSSDGKRLSTPPTTNLCSSGDASSIQTTAEGWIWSCLGSEPNLVSNCHAENSTLTDPIFGQCGSASAGAPSTEMPQQNLCLSGTPSSVNSESMTLWTWTCNGLRGGDSANCQSARLIKQNGVCGASANQTFLNSPSTQLCALGDASAVTLDQLTWRWSCAGKNGGTDDKCEATKSEPTIIINAAIDQDIAILVQDGDPDWNSILKKSCNADGYLWNVFNYVQDRVAYHQAFSVTSCHRISRAVETWAGVPNLTEIKTNLLALKAEMKSNLGKKKFIFGVFIAESINYTQNFYTDTGTISNVTGWCQPGSIGFWGQNTCTPKMSHPGYQIHLKKLVKNLIHLGITDIQFGQLSHIDENQQIGSLIQELRTLGNSMGIKLIIGGQPNIQYQSSYLANFDYIVGPSNITEEGFFNKTPEAIWTSPEDASRYAPNIWSPKYFLENPNNLQLPKRLVEIDWNSIDDDSHFFATLKAERRWDAAFDIYSYLTSQGMGWTFPIVNPLNSGIKPYLETCFGYNQWSYSDLVYSRPDSYSCNGLIQWEKMMNNTFVENSVSTKNTNLLKHLYKLYLNRESDSGGLAYFLDLLSKGESQASVTNKLKNSNEGFLVSLYRKKLNRNPSTGEIQTYLPQLESGSITRAYLENTIK